MASRTMDTRGRITIPKVVLDSIGLRPGDKVEFVEEHGQFHLRKVEPTAPSTSGLAL